ncbi:MAG TPA: epimerase, partial [Pedococcus sp.]|nr:epimerase [Pedococcus sp.]
REGAYNAAHAAVRARVGRIVYLGGLVPDVPEGDLSPHLRSRLEVEQVFGDSGVPTWALRAAMVVGAGSTSFEIMRQLSRRLPVQVVPSWMRSAVEPVAASDVVAALAGALTATGAGRTYDVGSGERMSYAALLRLYARLAGGRALQVPALLPTAFVARVAPLFTDVPASTVRSLVASLRHDMVCRDEDYVRDLLGPGSRPVPVADAIARALAASNPSGSGASGAGVVDPLGPLPTDPAWARPPGGAPA